MSLLRIVSFRMRVPCVDMTLLELLLAVVYVGGCLAWSFAPSEYSSSTQTMSPFKLFVTRIGDNILPRVNLEPATWGGNTGKLAAGQLPLAVVLALKNNPITCEYSHHVYETVTNSFAGLTGIGHERVTIHSRNVTNYPLIALQLVPVHRMVSRCIFVLVWLHLVGVYVRLVSYRDGHSSNPALAILDISGREYAHPLS